MGLPVSLDGSEGAQAQVALEFRDRLAEVLGGIPVETYDERLTTRMAEASAREGATALARIPSPRRTCSRAISPRDEEGLDRGIRLGGSLHRGRRGRSRARAPSRRARGSAARAPGRARPRGDGDRGGAGRPAAPSAAPPPEPPPAEVPPACRVLPRLRRPPSPQSRAKVARRRLIALVGVLALAFLAFVVVVVAKKVGGGEEVPAGPPPKARKTISLTIPEGYSRDQVAAVAKKAGLEGDYMKETESFKGFKPSKYGAEDPRTSRASSSPPPTSCSRTPRRRTSPASSSRRSSRTSRPSTSPTRSRRTSPSTTC